MAGEPGAPNGSVDLRRASRRSQAVVVGSGEDATSCFRIAIGSSGLTDVDLDYPTARALAGCSAFGLDHLVEFGRTSQLAGQRGHRLVIVPDSPNASRVFGIRSKEAATLVKQRGLGLTIVEIRGSNGSQTAVPPSIIRQPGMKPDRLVWSNPGAEFPELSCDELNRRVGRLAFAALAAAVYPEDNCDAFCSSVFGLLVESGVDKITAEQMVCEIVRLAGDETERDLLRDHQGEGLADFCAISGLEALEPVIRSWLGLEPADAIGSGQQPADHDYVQGDVKFGQIDAETLRSLLDVLDPCDFGGYYDHLSIVLAAHMPQAAAGRPARSLSRGRGATRILALASATSPASSGQTSSGTSGSAPRSNATVASIRLEPCFITSAKPDMGISPTR